MDMGLAAGTDSQRNHTIPANGTVPAASDLREDDGTHLLLRARKSEPENGGAG
jgi:hypothetical protein